ncbi:heterokaryon incompatibility protein-domain-containing protein [Phyllosticta capitalensis]
MHNCGSHRRDICNSLSLSTLTMDIRSSCRQLVSSSHSQQTKGLRQIDESDVYQYVKLATPSMIRVIKLEQNKVNNTISCVIRLVERGDVEYHALSYVWGDSKPTRQIYLRYGADQRRLFPLHENLWRFLDWAWNQQMFDKWLWTDRICLNQDDGDEISQQVPKMGEIFHDADQVIIWLGMSKKEGERVATILDRNSYYFSSGSWREELWKGYSPKTKRAALTAYYNEYWSRVWVLQEVALAKSATIVIGDKVVPYQDFKYKIDIIRTEHSSVPWDITPGPIRHTYHAQRDELWSVLRITGGGHFKCKEPNDRVYGILGLVASRADGTSPVDFIEVDYSKPYIEAYLDAFLESQPPVRETNIILDEMPYVEGSYIREQPFDTFKRYLDNPKTSARHRNLAGDLLQVCDAFNTMFLILGSGPGCWAFSRLIHGSLRELEEICIPNADDRTLRDSAAMKGVAVALGLQESKEPSVRFGRRQKFAVSAFEDWKASRRPYISAQSPWRCAAHHKSHEDNSQVPRAGKMKDFRDAPGERLRSSYWGRLASFCVPSCHLAEVCGRYSHDSPRSCDTTTMVFDLPEVGFRVVFEQMFEFATSGRVKKFPNLECRCSGAPWSDWDDGLVPLEEAFFGKVYFEFLDTDMYRKGLEDLRTW